MKLRKKLRKILYKFILVLIVLNVFKWVPHPFGLNMAQSVGAGGDYGVNVELPDG